VLYDGLRTASEGRSFRYLQVSRGTRLLTYSYLGIVHALRSYRLVPALLALSLVLTAASPLIQHSCGMTDAEMATMPCCEGGVSAHEAPAMHGDVDLHGATDTPPCHDAPATPQPPPPCPDDGPAVHDACCYATDAPTAPTPERPQFSSSALVALVAAFVLPTPPPVDAHASPPTDSSPPAPVALHLLYGSFLT
jgi:hypothetical protein